MLLASWKLRTISKSQLFLVVLLVPGLFFHKGGGVVLDRVNPRSSMVIQLVGLGPFNEVLAAEHAVGVL